MPSTLKVPMFSSESEEADWRFANRHLVEEELRSAMAEGRTSRGSLMRQATMADTSIQLDAEDVTKAQAAAVRKGISYQSYVKMLIHEALEKESAA